MLELPNAPVMPDDNRNDRVERLLILVHRTAQLSMGHPMIARVIHRTTRPHHIESM
jgi:hypothetical protein